MTLSKHREANISSDGTVVKYSYPEDKLKASLKELKKICCRCGTMAHKCYLCRSLDKIFGAELNG